MTTRKQMLKIKVNTYLVFRQVNSAHTMSQCYQGMSEAKVEKIKVCEPCGIYACIAYFWTFVGSGTQDNR
jgi:hypothetical protein